MEEFDDSLDEGNGMTECVITINRHTDLEATNQLINSLGNPHQHQTQQYHLQTENIISAPNTNPDMERTENDFTRRSSLNNRQQNINAGSPVNVHKRSGPDGSPAFNQSSGFLPHAVDNESVIFMPVRQLNFSSLDETTRTEEFLLNQEEQNRPDLPLVNDGRNASFMSEHRQEVYGSQDTGEESRENSPAAGFFELKSSPLQSSESGEELDSRVIFSPVRGVNDQSQVTLDETDISRSEFQKYLMAGHLSQRKNKDVVDDDEDAYQEPNLAKSSPNRSKILDNSGMSGSPSRNSYQDDNGEPMHNYLSPAARKNLPHSVLSPSHKAAGLDEYRNDKREVFVSIPHAVPDDSSYTLSARRGSPGERNLNKDNDNGISDQAQTGNYGNQQGRMVNDHISPNAAWEIPFNEDSKQNKGHNRDPKGTSKAVYDRKPFVSSVKNDINSYQPKVPSQASGVAKKESQLPRPKTKGSDAKQSHVEPRLQRTDPSQGQRNVSRGQRVNEGQQYEYDRRSGPIPSHIEARLMSKRNMMAANDKQAKPGINREDNRKGMESARNKPYVQDAPKNLTGVPITGKQQELSPVHPATNLVTQVQHYGQSREDKGNDAALDVKGMEEVRSQLQNMLKFSGNAFHDQRDFDVAGQGFPMDAPVDPVQLPMDYSLMSGSNPDDVSDLLENFPSFTSHMWTESSTTTRGDASLHAENQRLREVLEKERYRRKHCEQYIQRLNVKLLETQQQVAVAVSTDKRKDIMIEQLDKQLAKVVEGWKKRDEDKEQLIGHLKTDKVKVEEKLVKQNEMIQNFEKDMSDALEQLRKEKNEASLDIDQLKSQLSDFERSKNHAEEMLEAEKERTELINQEWETMKETREHLEKKIQQLQDRSRSEQDDWFKREQELLQRIEEVGNNNKKIVQQEKEKCEESLKLSKEMEEKLYATQTEVRRLEMEIDAAVREKESLKVEMSIMEAKFEGSQRTLEAELHSQMEKEIAEQIADVHKRMEETENEMRENHHKQIKDLNQRHNRDIEKSMAKFHDDLKNREEEFRKLTLEYEQKLQEQRSEISTLQQTRQKLESQRSEILMKLQYMMQSQWNEAVQLLASTPQRKNLASVSFSSQTPTASNLNTSVTTTSQAAFPVTSSPARSSTSHPPPPTETDLSDLATSLHVQQLLQSLSQPMIFPHSTRNPSNENFSGQDSSSRRQMPSHSQRSELPPKVSALPEVRENLEETDADRLNTHVQNWLHTSVGSRVHPGVSSYGEQSQSLHGIESSNLGPNGQYHGPQSLQQHYSSEFVPNLKDNDMPHSHSVTAVPIRPPQRDQRNLLDHSDTYHDMHERTENHSFESAKSVDNVPSNQLRKQQKSIQSQGSPDHVHTTTSRNFPGRTQTAGTNSQEGVRNENKYPQQNPAHSPPTKQSRRRVNEEYRVADSGSTPGGSVHEESVRLNAEYNTIAERFEQHESKQGELQHYIQMLLQKPPGDPVIPPGLESNAEENVSQYSQDQTEELDLNDTAQAAQLQQELNRIQQLREKHSKQQDASATEKHPQSLPVLQSVTGQENHSLVLQPEQLAEISRMLNQYQEQNDGSQNTSKSEEEQMIHLVSILQNLQSKGHIDQGNNEGRRGIVNSPGSPKHKDVNKVKRNLRDQLGGQPVEGGQVKGEKANVKQPQRKPERKVANSVKPLQGKSKSAWK